MDVLITFGRYAGQVRDIEPSAALAMLNDGRAKRPGEELEPAVIGGAVPEVQPRLGTVADRLEDAAVPSRRRSRR